MIRMVPRRPPSAEPEIPDTGLVDFLLALVKNVQDGSIKPASLVVHYLQETPDGSLRHGYWTWHVPPVEHLGLLAVATADVIQAQRG